MFPIVVARVVWGQLSGFIVWQVFKMYIGSEYLLTAKSPVGQTLKGVMDNT